MRALIVALSLFLTTPALAECIPAAALQQEAKVTWSIEVARHEDEAARHVIATLAPSADLTTLKFVYVYQDPNDGEIFLLGVTAEGCAHGYLVTNEARYKQALEGRGA